MWPVPIPDYDAGETFSLCISRVRDPGLRARLNGAKPLVEAAATDYDARAQATELHLIATAAVVGAVTAAEMKKVYDWRMARMKTPGRKIYDNLMVLPVGDRCPFCDQRNVTTLDHILPKAHYPALAVVPINLVASCKDCNTAKLDHAPARPEDCFLHPYYEDVSEDHWLQARVITSSPCAVVFRFAPVADWDATLAQRVQNQFRLLGLAKLYGSEAAREISNIRHNLRQHFQTGGANAVQSELRRQWESRRANRINCWQTATYEALMNSNWFCNGGFDR